MLITNSTSAQATARSLVILERYRISPQSAQPEHSLRKIPENRKSSDKAVQHVAKESNREAITGPPIIPAAINARNPIRISTIEEIGMLKNDSTTYSAMKKPQIHKFCTLHSSCSWYLRSSASFEICIKNTPP